MINIETIWSRLKEHEGEQFYKAGGEGFTYSFHNEQFKPSCANQFIGKNQFEKALTFYPFSKVSDISNSVRGGSYVFAVLTDSRIMDEK